MTGNADCAARNGSKHAENCHEEQMRQGKYPNSVDTTQAWPYNRSNLETGLARTGKSGNESALTPGFPRWA